jgi:hypothetical protein
MGVAQLQKAFIEMLGLAEPGEGTMSGRQPVDPNGKK